MWWLCLALAAGLQAQPPPAISRAVAAFQHGDAGSAERILETYLQTQPTDQAALGFLGIVLDQENKHSEADQAYRHALALGRSPGLLNNYGNHLLLMGKKAQARQIFLQVLEMDPKHANALLQLARIQLEDKAPAEALSYLRRLPADDPHRDFEFGVALSATGQYAEAETHFARTLEKEPDNFDALYDLGLAASHAGHNQRAREVLQQALQKQPENANVLYNLAIVDSALGDKENALQLLVRARQAAPDRPDVESLLAHTAAKFGYFADAVEAWDAYLKLRPADDDARRERAFAESAIGENGASALADLRAFVAKYPRDAVGHYELGTAESPRRPDEALPELNRAIALDPGLTEARVVRGLLLYRRGKADAALADFQFAAGRDPQNAVILDHLGETLLSLSRPQDALAVLRKAANLAPQNSTVLFHLGRALTAVGDSQQAAAVFARYRESGARKATLPHPAGLVEFLTLSHQEQLVRYREGVERTVKHDPQNVEAETRWLELLLQDGNSSEAASVCRTIESLRPASSVVAEVAGQLLSAGQYALANDFLEQTSSGSTVEPELLLDRGLAAFHVSGPSAALADLDRIPAEARNGDYYLARFQILTAIGRLQDANAALKQVVEQRNAPAPKRPELYRQAALQLIADGQFPTALSLLDEASRSVPNRPDIETMKSIALELAGRNSEEEFKRIEAQWPEWATGWIAHALVLAARHQTEAARHCLQVAVELGADDPAVAYCRGAMDGGDPTSNNREAFLVRGFVRLFS